MSAAVASTDKADKVRELHDRLVAQVEALVTGEDWARYLRMAARFHSYSASNVWLMLAQRPDLAVTGDRVAGYQGWKRLGRQVQAGSKGIAILAPCVYRRGADEAGPPSALADSQTDSTTESAGAARVLRGFKVVHVFAERHHGRRPARGPPGAPGGGGGTVGRPGRPGDRGRVHPQPGRLRRRQRAHELRGTHRDGGRAPERKAG